MSDYPCTSRDYLSRAIALRAAERPEKLFYAAFELRCGIEARLQEYLSRASTVATVKRDLWQVRLLLREVERAYGVYAKSVVVKFAHPETGGVTVVEYTPVTPSLRNIAEKLGDFLHFAHASKLTPEKRISSLVGLVDAGIMGLKFATRGILLGPPRGSGPKREQMTFMFESGRTPSFIKEGVTAKFTMKFTVVGKSAGKIHLKPV